MAGSLGSSDTASARKVHPSGTRALGFARQPGGDLPRVVGHDRLKEFAVGVDDECKLSH